MPRMCDDLDFQRWSFARRFSKVFSCLPSFAFSFSEILHTRGSRRFVPKEESVSCYSQAVEELIEDGFNGWTFRPDHPDEIYASLDRAINVSETQLYEMREAGRERIRCLIPEYGAKCFLAAIDFVRASRGGKAPTKPDKVMENESRI